MLRVVLLVGLVAGLAAGLATAVLQHFTTVPLIIAAESYEVAALPLPPGSALAAHDHDPAAAADDHGEAGWMPTDGLERTLSTTVATVVSGIGFALVLVGAMLVSGGPMTTGRALAFAACGFVATGLAPGLGLAPELPGAAAGPLLDRQIWWGATAALTAAGLFLILRRGGVPAIAAGVVLIVAPHVFGAPHADGFASGVPAELAAHFASTSLAVHAAFWGMVGAGVGLAWQRFGPPLQAA